MAQWGRNDQSVTANDVTTVETSNGAPIGTYSFVKAGGGPNAHFGNTSAGSRAATDVAMFGNTTVGAFIPGMAVGVFGVDAAEGTTTSGSIALTYVTNPGSGYGANAAVTITVTNGGTSGVVNAYANSIGRISQIKIQTAGSGYKTDPTIAVAAPAAVVFNGNTNVSGALITTASAGKFVAGDKITYAGNSLSTPAPLVDTSTYYISFANSSVVALAATKNGANIALTKASGDSSTAAGATITGETAAGYVVVGGAKNNGVTHAGWVIRREGTGGRAGRVQYETLVAMGSLGAQSAPYGTPALVADAADDTIIPDA
jgi:hypothetical protein